MSKSWSPIPNLFGRDAYTEYFYDVKLFNQDTFDVSDDFEYIAEMYFRLDTDLMDHGRVDYTMYNLVEDLGGISELLVKTSAFVLGGFLSFNASLVIIDDLYSAND